jgi:Polysaccharide deacetylase
VKVCITLDLEPDYAGVVPTAYTAWQAPQVERLASVLAQHNVPMTAFVVAESLRAHPEIVGLLQRGNVEFQLHSFSHDLAHPDSSEEIRRGKEVFESHFGHAPLGYRAPQGLISPAGWRRLDEEGFVFDASVFPAIWPRPRYLRYPRRPFRPAGCRLIAIPAGTLTPARLVVSVSWFKLLGWPLYRWLLTHCALPDPLVLGMHLHDLWPTGSSLTLRGPWTWVYRDNTDSGFTLLTRFIELMQGRGASFETMGNVAKSLVARGAPTSGGGTPC